MSRITARVSPSPTRGLVGGFPRWPTQLLMKKRTIPAAQFKAQCLGLLDEVEKGQTQLVITKRGRPVARVVPLERPTPRKKLGGRIVGDIVGSIEPEWIAWREDLETTSAR